MNQPVLAAEYAGKLIEQSAVGAGEPVFGLSAKLCDLLLIHGLIQNIQYGIRGRHFERGGAGEPGPHGDGTQESAVESFNRLSQPLLKVMKDPFDVVGPSGIGHFAHVVDLKSGRLIDVDGKQADR